MSYTIEIHNRSAAGRKTHRVTVEDEETVDAVLGWYNAYSFGDNYTVHVNDVKQKLDQNGERVK